MFKWLRRLFRRETPYKSHLAPLNPRLMAIHLENMRLRK
jgi:hypothetical protein